ncbi:MAG: hypothetical protein IPP04_17520 [Saprospiraceae bacterium]|nr:hypothetical protein [Saprospiraceae bacterium]
MKNIYSIIVLLFIIVPIFGQKIPQVKLNHIYLVIPSQDLIAIQNNDFFTRNFSSIETRTTKANNGDSWTGTYLYGKDNYLELFDSLEFQSSVGISGIAFSVDKIGELLSIKTHLENTYLTEFFQRERNFENEKVPWFEGLSVVDTIFDMNSLVGFWIMEYKKEYFIYNKFNFEDSLLTKESYLSKFSAGNTDKILNRFTGIVMQLSQYETDYFNILLNKLGYKKSGKTKYTSADNFVFTLNKRTKNSKSSILAIEFETNKKIRKRTITISDNVLVTLSKKKGKILFRN